MSINVPDKFDHLEAGEVSTGQEIRAPDWQEMIEGQNYLWSLFGSRVAGFRWDPQWQTSETSFSVHDQGTSETSPREDLDRFVGLHRVRRLTTSDTLIVTIGIFVDYLEVEWTIDRLDNDGTSNEIYSGVHGGNSRYTWHTPTVTMTAEQLAPAGTLRPLRHTIRARKPGNDLGLGQLWQVGVWEAIGDASQIP